MLTLAIDTASNVCGAALWQGGEDGELRAVHEEQMARGHSEALFGIIACVLDNASVKPGEISRFAAIRGPGSFTGLRIGLAAVRGLALALDATAVGMTAFELIAAQDFSDNPGDDARLIAIDARRGEIYAAILGSDLEFIEPPSLLLAEDAARFVGPGRTRVIGSATHLVADAAHKAGKDLQTRPTTGPGTALLARIASTVDPNASPPEPLYIRAPDAKLPQTLPLREARSD